MSENGNKFDSWFESLADEALIKNARSAGTWTKYKDDLEETKRVLTWLPDKLKYDVMVPIGSKALMRGKLVRTNEVMVSLGDAWFAKKSARDSLDVCDRRLAACREMLDRLEKEKELLESKKSLPGEREAFGSEERPEIIEHVTEEEEQEWRKRHREREREYRQRLAEMKRKEKKPIETEEDLWNRLDELELREELEDELERLNADGESECSEESEEASDPSCDRTDDSRTKEPPDIDSTKSTRSSKCQVSFMPDSDDSDSEPVRLEIKHSDNVPVFPAFNGVVDSPADIYAFHAKTTRQRPQSILKIKKNVNEEKEWEAVRGNRNDDDDDESITQVCDPVIETNIINSTFILPDIVARDPRASSDRIIAADDKTIETRQGSAKRVSKFKASRMNKY